MLLGEGNSDPNNLLPGSILADYEPILSNNNIQTGTTATASNFSGSLEGLSSTSQHAVRSAIY